MLKGRENATFPAKKNILSKNNEIKNTLYSLIQLTNKITSDPAMVKPIYILGIGIVFLSI